MTTLIIVIGLIGVIALFAWRAGKHAEQLDNQQDAVDAGDEANEVDKKVDGMSAGDKRDRLRKHK